MSTMSPYSLTDENPDLHKQIGCMNGIFQLFDRRHFLSGRRISSHNHKRLPPGQSGNHGMEPNCMTQKAIEKDLKGVVKEKQRVSESSSTSFSSSSCSSTVSSFDCNKTAQLESSSLGHSILPETPSQMSPKKQRISSLSIGRQSLDLQDAVKDSIYRGTHGLSIKTTTKAEGISHFVKYVDSPRPLQLSNSVKPKVYGLDGSLRGLAKHREAPQISNEERSQAPPSKDTPRFSYDGRESRDTWKSTIKLKELPRLSLDSREGFIKSSAFESRSNCLLHDPQQGNGKSSQTLNPNQEPGSNKRPSSVVAKLMGLEEAFPDSISDNNDRIRKIQCSPDENLDAMSSSTRKVDESKHNQVSRSPRTPQKEPASPQLRNINSVMKPNSRFPLEPAPWRQPDGNRGSQKPAFIYQEAHTKAQNWCPSVYGEIEKKLTELEFKRSGKDLRALKQILEAMQKTRERLQNKKEDQAPDLEPQKSNHGPNYCKFDQNSISAMQCSQQSIHPITPAIKGTGPPKKFESSILIIKPAKVIPKPRNSGSSAIRTEGISALRKLRTSDNADSKKDSVDKRTAEDTNPRNKHFREPSCQHQSTNARTYRSTQTSKAAQHTDGGIPTSPGRGSTTVSQRLQQNKHGMEKQSHPTTQTSDPTRARRHLSKQQAETGSPSRKFKPKSPNLQQRDDQLNKICSETRHLSHQGDTISVHSESNTSSASASASASASQTDTEVTSIDHSKEMNGAYQHKEQKNEITARLRENTSKAETTTANLEQPSPISVLDYTFYIEESPSPV